MTVVLLLWILSSIRILLITIGTLLNGFIVTINLVSWLKGQDLQPIDLIITSLGAVRLILLLFCLSCSLAFSYIKNIDLMTVILYTSTTAKHVLFCSLWWGTVLCVFYCVKITNYSNRLFTRLKMNISRMVPWLLLVTMVVSFLSSLPYTWFISQRQHMNFTNYNNSFLNGRVISSHNFILMFLGSIIPFLIFCSAMSLLIISLLKHTRNISSKDSGFSNIQCEVHIKAICNMFTFLFFYLLNFISLNLIFVGFKNPLYNIISDVCTLVHPSLHSIALIGSNVKLKRSILTCLCCARKKH